MRQPRRVRRRRPGAATALAVSALGLLGTACDLFPTRTPLEGGGGNHVWQTPVGPQIIVENLRSSFEAGVFGDYERTMYPDFLFIPDDSDVFDIEVIRPGEEVFANWNRAVETTTAEVIFGSVPALTLELSLIREELITDGRLLKYDYALSLRHADREPTVYVGEAWFTIRQELGSGEWFIYRWEDIASSITNRSWGFLKGQSRP
jgi:hypothetical protein